MYSKKMRGKSLLFRLLPSFSFTEHTVLNNDKNENEGKLVKQIGFSGEYQMRKNFHSEKTANFFRLKTDRLFADYENAYKYDGLVDDAFRFVLDRQLMRVDLWARFVQQFREGADCDAGWRGEYWGKMMRGACFVYSYTKSPELYKILSDTVIDLLGTEDENGRISSYPISHEFDGWDLWGRKYVLLGMQYFIEICDDDALKHKIIQSMCNQVDYLIEKIGNEEGKRKITSCTRHWRGLNSSSILEPIARLYSLTGNQKYFDFAKYIVESPRPKGHSPNSLL
jgi:DUF1680 family protein